jgi:hypothetical protein
MDVPESNSVTERGPSLGTFQSRDIPAFIVTKDGRRHEFVGTGDSPFDLAQLKPNESVIAPGLIYRAVPSEGDQIGVPFAVRQRRG